jgi:2-amino-4-hydroxy-6-hydroxymethyldihydropteridine diphosphokinase
LKEHLVYLSLGSNLGDRSENLNIACDRIQKSLGRKIAVSQIYESAPWGYSSVHHFYNCCISLLTRMDPWQLLDGILAIEQSMGRIRGGTSYSDRLIDLDLLFYGDRVIDDHRLTVPHPRMEERRFVLMPLAEIAADFVHPVHRLTVQEMLEHCPDPGAVKTI